MSLSGSESGFLGNSSTLIGKATRRRTRIEELRKEEPLDEASQKIHDEGLVSVLLDLHEDLDRAVTDPYGWPADLSTEDILFRLVELNAARALEEPLREHWRRLHAGWKAGGRQDCPPYKVTGWRRFASR